MENFKIKVTPEQSKIVQKILFQHGVSWEVSGKNVSHTDVRYLYCNDDTLVGGSFPYYFVTSPDPELTFEQFIKKYSKQRISRTRSLNEQI